MKLRVSNLLLAGLVLACVGATLVLSGALDEASAGSAEIAPGAAERAPSARSKFTLPKLFDFERFKRLFRKGYQSLLEEMARKKLFLARAFRVFVASVKYKMGLISSYLGINEMSDWTREEVESMYMKEGYGDPFGTGSPVHHQASQASEDLAPQVASEEEIEHELANILARKDEPGYAAISAELLSQQTGGRRRRQARRRQLDLDDLVRAPVEAAEPPEVQRKILGHAESNNPDYEEPEMISYGSKEPDLKTLLQHNQANILANLPGAKFLGSMVKSASDALASFVGAEPMEIDNELPDEGELEDVVYVDHRRSNCMFQARNQRQCGSCYAFSTIALYEWRYCQETGRLLALSEQYIVDCGPGRVRRLDGCDGAWTPFVGKFVAKYGLELRVNYPYRMRQDECPYENKTHSKQMGFIKTAASAEIFKVDPAKMDIGIEMTPMVIAISTCPGFHEYAGGVDQPPDCSDKPTTHAMLLIGAGREDGIDYWLIRNSHGITWGESGHYKLAKTSVDFNTNAWAWTTMAVFAKENAKNPNYNQKPILRRYADYLTDEDSESEA